MDPATVFFAKLKKLTVTLESETAKLQDAFENRNNDGDSETTARAMRAYHQLNCDVGNMKGQIQDQLAQQRAREDEVSSFIKSCRVMEQRVTKDIQTLKAHWEKYGYQAPKDTQRTSNQESHAEDRVWESEEEAGDDQASPLHMAGPPPITDVMRTPRLSDFGLSELQMKRALAWSSEAPPMPQMSLQQPSLNTPAPPPMPITPKCALRMDGEDLQTPQIHNYGISEHTMCLLNDFTMDLLQKNIEKASRPLQDIPAPPVNSVMESLQAKEVPELCTPGFEIKKTKSHCFPPAGDGSDLEILSTPEVPAFQTRYLKHMFSEKKSARQPEPVSSQSDDDFCDLPTPPRKESTGSKRMWKRDVPEMAILGVEEEQTPEMPNLQSDFLQSRSSKLLKKTSGHEKLDKEPCVDPTMEFSLRTPRLRRDFQEPCTPEMPDLSSVTQDLCKLFSLAQMKRSAMAIVPPQVRAEKENSPVPTAASVSVVSESEFQSLPGYLRQMSLHNLNQAIHNINKFMAECPGEKTEIHMEELRRITGFGAKTPVYILCLTELKRLTHLRGAKNTSVYKLSN